MTSIKKILTLVTVLVLLVIAIAISSLNADRAALDLHWFQLNWPLCFPLLLFFRLGVLLGVMLGWFFWTWPAHREKTHWKRNYHQLKQSHEKEVAELQQKILDENSEDQVKLP